MNKIPTGSKIAIIAPSGQIGSKDKIDLGLKYLQSLGFTPVYGKHTFDVYRYMAGSDKKRAEDVNAAFANPEIAAIFCVRAAAGASRILPYLDYELIKNNPKPLIGFCDNAALELAINKKSNIICWNGFLPTYDFKDGQLDKLVKDSFEQLLKGQPYQIRSGSTIRSGEATGQLLCCNLSTLMRLAGTPYFPNLSGKILLIEDVHERLHKIDLMLQQLKQQPNFAKLKGLIFGQFTDSSGDKEDGTLEDCFTDFLQDTSFPVVKDFAFGHTPARYVLPLGAKVKLNSADCCLNIVRY